MQVWPTLICGPKPVAAKKPQAPHPWFLSDYVEVQMASSGSPSAAYRYDSLISWPVLPSRTGSYSMELGIDGRKTGVLHTGTTDNWFDRRWWLWGHEEHSAGEESASAVARSEPNRPKIKALESGCARGDVVTKGIQSIQGVPDRVAF